MKQILFGNGGCCGGSEAKPEKPVDETVKTEAKADSCCSTEKKDEAKSGCCN